MIHKLLFIILVAFFVNLPEVNSQANLLNARVPQDVGRLSDDQKKASTQDPLSYGFVDDRDILWSKTVWERIDVDERINFPYYYPTDTFKL